MTDQQHDHNNLADKLDQALPPNSTSISSENNEPLVNAAIWIASAPRPGFPPKVKADLEAQLIQRAQELRVNRRTVRPNFQPLLRWALVASVVLAIVSTGVPTTLASVPGDVLYPVKQALEQVEIIIANSPQNQANLKLTHAERRLQEVKTLLSRGQWHSELITDSLDQMVGAAQIARTESNFPPSTMIELESRTVELNMAMAELLAEVSQMDIQSSAFPIMTAVAATQSSGALLLPQTATPSPTITAMPTQTATPVSPDDPTLTPTLEVNLVIEGPVQAINGNVVVIYGINVELDADDPILDIIKIGDYLRVAGNIATLWNDSATDAAVETELSNHSNSSDAITNEEQNIWIDNGNCDNPPPDWAPANGWRARCEGQSEQSGRNTNPPAGGNASPPGQQDNPGQSQGNSRGQGANRKNK